MDVTSRNSERAENRWKARHWKRHYPLETNFLNGEIVRLAHRHGIAAPFNAELARAARAAVANGLGPERYSAAQLAELLGIDAITTAPD